MNGYQSLINYWRDALSENGVNVRLNTKVTKILWKNSDGTVTVQTENGDSFQADHVILTVSLGILNSHF
jgi:protoporphyrinogen oxidase